jgi:hypothetical protein
MTRATGLFYYDTVKGEETRLFHRADFVSSPFCVLPDRRIVVTTPLRDGSSCLTLLNERGIEVRALTEGGAQDQNPFFHEGAIYFNSYGLGRDDDGHIRARSHSTVNRIPLGEGDVECVLEDENYDFILPRCAPDGTLYAIRMPRVPLQSYNALDAAKDVLLFPVRLGMALFGFLNAFTTVFGKQSLTTAGGPPTKREQDNKQLIHDRLVDLAQESKKAGERVAAPADWQLIRWRNGVCEVVAKRVSTYDLIGETVVYSSGYDVTVLGEGKKLTSPNRLQFLSTARS